MKQIDSENTLLAIAEKSLEKSYQTAYRQGIDHSLGIAKTLSQKSYDSLHAFLLELSIELDKLKKA